MTSHYSTELFPQLDTLQQQYQNSAIATESYNPNIYYPNNQEQLNFYLYQEQRQNNNHILDSDTMLYPVPYIPYQSFNEQQQCNIVYNTSPIQQPMLQSSISPISHGESPLSMKSDNFTMHQNPQQQGIAPYYTYDHALDMNLMTPPTTLYDSNLMSPPAPVHDFLSAVTYEPIQQHQRRSSVSSLSSLSSISSKSSGKCFVSKSKQNNTVLFHCEYEGCTKTFTRTYNLKSHRRTHTDEKPFACHLCPKAFARQHDRNRHEKLHLGLKPYPCEYCSKSFARLDALNRHLKRDKRNNSKDSPPPCLLLKLKKANSKKKKLV